MLELGEGPVWDAPRDRLLWVDIMAGHVYEGRLRGDDLEVTGRRAFDEPVGSVLPAADGGMVVAGARHLRVLDASSTITRSIRVLADEVQSRLNDAACDPAGRILVGGVRQDGRVGQESLVGVDARGALSTLVEGVSVSNGIGFSPDGTEMYYVDSVPGLVRAFDYDVTHGTCSRPRALWSGDGIPDGLCVDVNGNLWIAFFGEGEVRCLSPAGELLGIVGVPVPNPTCAAFVGPELDRLLITTARRKLDTEDLQRWPDSGGLFIADVGVRGLPPGAWAGSTSGIR